jgi:hypothetical protein
MVLAASTPDGVCLNLAVLQWIVGGVLSLVCILCATITALLVHTWRSHVQVHKEIGEETKTFRQVVHTEHSPRLTILEDKLRRLEAETAKSTASLQESSNEAIERLAAIGPELRSHATSIEKCHQRVSIITLNLTDVSLTKQQAAARISALADALELDVPPHSSHPPASR